METCALTQQTQKVAINPTLHNRQFLNEETFDEEAFNEETFNEETLNNSPLPLLLTRKDTIWHNHLLDRLTKPGLA